MVGGDWRRHLSHILGARLAHMQRNNWHQLSAAAFGAGPNHIEQRLMCDNRGLEAWHHQQCDVP